MRQAFSCILCCFTLAACSGSGSGSAARPAPPVSPPPSPPSVACNEALEFCGAIPGSADPCADTQYWPLSSSSALRPVTVHYSRLTNEAKALEMITLLEESWTVQVDMLGFSAPLDDQGNCGADGDFDVFIWPGIDGAFVSSVDDNPATSYQDYSTYMAIDISGAVGGTFLDTYMAHEFNHALQASDDWTEAAQHYEAGATFAEALVYPDETDWYFEMRDFQDNPQWSLFYDDFATSWYTYAAAMYLHYLYERYYPGDPAFYARLWRGTRSDVGDDRPDYIDALRLLLMTERGVTLDETIVEFMQWRWFVAEFDDGAHFAKGADWPHTVAVTDIDASAIPVVQILDAMVYGTNFIRVSNSGASPVSFNAAVSTTDLDVSWRLLDVASGAVAAPVTLMPNDNVVFVAVVLPAVEVWTGSLSFEQRTADLTFTINP